MSSKKSRLGKSASEIFRKPVPQVPEVERDEAPSLLHPAVWWADMIYLQTKAVNRFLWPGVRD